MRPAEVDEENVFMCNTKDIVNDGFYSARLKLLPMLKSLMDVQAHCEGSNHSVSRAAQA